MKLNVIILCSKVAFNSLRQLLDYMKDKVRRSVLGHRQHEGFRYLAANSECAVTWQTTATWQIREHVRRTFTAHLFHLAQTELTAESRANFTLASTKLLPFQVESAGRCLGSPPREDSLPCGWARPPWIPQMERPTYPTYTQPGSGTQTGCVSTTLQTSHCLKLPSLR